MDIISSVTSELGNALLTQYMARHRVIAHNIANHATEGYQAQRLSFEAHLSGVREALAEQAPREQLRARIGEIRSDLEPAADPTVRLDDEMAALSRNALDYETVLTVMQRYGGLMRQAVGGGARR